MKQLKISLNLFLEILSFSGYILFLLKGLSVFIPDNHNEVYLYTFPITLFIGLAIIFLFILVVLKLFNYSVLIIRIGFGGLITVLSHY